MRRMPGDRVTLPALPFELAWTVAPAAARVDDGVLEADAGPDSDLFHHPGGRPRRTNAAMLLGQPPDGDLLLSAHVDAALAHDFDAGALIVWQDAETWAKLALERSPDGDATFVTVVTDGLSDDSTHQAIPGNAAWLRVARTGTALAFHASQDGQRWTFLRQFALPSTSPQQLGFSVQAPHAPGCRARFSDVRFEQRTLAELRDGS
jgi:regulation of enolase protein 1 (concanavalin A-like superfamily)